MERGGDNTIIGDDDSILAQKTSFQDDAQVILISSLISINENDVEFSAETLEGFCRGAFDQFDSIRDFVLGKRIQRDSDHLGIQIESKNLAINQGALDNHSHLSAFNTLKCCRPCQS